jgi:SAM-dependent methyltransferase
MAQDPYIMESEDEALRLDLKTDPALVETQARWAGIRSGMRIADLGCGPGKTTSCLHRLVQPGGESTGVDYSSGRIAFARSHYEQEQMAFVCRDIRDPLDDLGKFDFIWVRFVLEYHRNRSLEIVRNASRILNPGGILCLIDLDHNCLSHFGLPPRLERSLHGAMAFLQERWDFDPYAGRKLYSYLYDMEFEHIDVRVEPYHVIFGKPDPVSVFNWRLKVKVAAQGSGYAFEEYPDGFSGFLREFEEAFADPRRFTYTPLICCRGVKP